LQTKGKVYFLNKNVTVVFLFQVLGEENYFNTFEIKLKYS